MTGVEIMGKESNDENKWIFPKTTPTEKQKRILISRAVEIGVKVLFQNFIYKFNNKLYQQVSGGPIGARITMGAARLVVNDWGEEYTKILLRSEIRIHLRALYVDDVRQATSKIKKGVRFSEKEKKFVYSPEWEKLDLNEGESDLQRMAKESRKAMNSVYSNLNFTIETEEDFENGRLPTLDFEMWVDENQVIQHSFYEKPVNTPYVVMERSAMGEQAKNSILANDLIRRLSNIRQNIFDKEKTRVIDHYTEKLRLSGYNFKQAREVITSGLRGYEAKVRRAEKEKRPLYRKARDTLKQRIRKKLTEKTTWYRKRKTEQEGEKQSGKKIRTRADNASKKKAGSKNNVKAVIFVPRTRSGELAKLLREKEQEMENLTGYRFKIVERTGLNLERLLHKSNPWSGEDCARDSCLLCESKGRSEEQPQSCYERNSRVRN